MNSIEDDIKNAVVPPRQDDEAFRLLRAGVRGTIIQAHRELTGPTFEWLATDDRIMDIVTAWLDQCRSRGRIT